MHGAIGAADQLEGLKTSLSDTCDVHTLNFSGHGGKAMPDAAFSIPLFAEDVLRYMREQGLEQAHIFGYSMGGYVALYLAKHHPERVGKIVTLATKFHWDEVTAAKEVKMLDAEKIAQKLPDFAAALERRHAPNDWKEVLAKTADLLHALGADNTLKPDDYMEISTPCLVLLGDRDRMITLEETLQVYRALPDAQMGMLPGTHHPIEQADEAALRFFIDRFLR